MSQARCGGGYCGAGRVGAAPAAARVSLRGCTRSPVALPVHLLPPLAARGAQRVASGVRAAKGRRQ